MIIMRSRSSSTNSISDLFRPNNPKRLRSRDLSSTRLNVLKKEIDTNSHLITLTELYIQYETNPVTGLASTKAAQLLLFYGQNALTPATQNGWAQVLFTSLCTGFSILIWLGALLCMIAYFIEAATKTKPNKDNFYLGCVLITVDLICGFFSFVQNYKSSKIMSTFNNMLPTNAHCIRDGVLAPETFVCDLVKGDIVFIYAGDVVPADVRIIESKGFKVDNSSLTGESIAVTRSNAEGTTNILESPNVAFFSTQCVEGWAKGVVLCCGDLTALGRVAGLATRLQPEPSPLSKGIRRFMRCISIFAITVGFIIASASLALGYPLIQTIIFVIGVIVANIPEGLQPTVTASLTLTAKQMVKRNCLVKNLEAVEALGACTTICSDKTGTLTENRMRVQDVVVCNQVFSVSNSKFAAQLANNQAFSALSTCGAVCSTADITEEGYIRGDASETAILKFLQEHSEPFNIRSRFPKVTEIPFNSLNKYQVSVHYNVETSQYIVMMKGAPEYIYTRCQTIAFEKGDKEFTDQLKHAVEKVIEDLGTTGERILAFADFELDPKAYPKNYEFNADNVNFPITNLRLLGMMGMIDPPRQEVRSAIQRVRSAGVRVMMVTGDHPATARAVALEVGIASTANCHVITGTQLREMTPDLLALSLLKHYEIVFARTSPTQKLQIVEACQRQGSVVAVTGDGVNDAPALRKADVGISMGITGSQVSKQTADIILLDDNFATIVVGIEEGRKIFDNLKKSICYILISNVPQIVPVLMFILFSIPLPLGVMTILCIDLGTDMWPSVALAYEGAETDVMQRPPCPSAVLVSNKMLRLAYGHLGLIETAAGLFAYFMVMAEFGFYPEKLFGLRDKWDNSAISDVEDSLGQEWTYGQRKELERIAQTSYFVAVVVMQMMNGIMCKTRYNSLFHVGMKNKILNIGLVVELIVAVIICYVPGINDIFRTYPLRIRWWFLSTPFILLFFAFEEFRKYCIRKNLFGGWYNQLTYY